MIPYHENAAPKQTRGLTGLQLEKELASHLSPLLGVFEEYQSSAIALVHLRNAVVREPHLASVLRPSLTDMRRANQALRKEFMQLQHEIATQMDTSPVS